MFPHCSRIPLPDLVVLRASGPEAADFLHAQLSCDVHHLDPQAHVLAAHCNAQGRVLHLFRLCRLDDDWLLLLPASLAEEALASLRRFILRRKLSLALDSSLAATGLIAQPGTPACLPEPGRQQRHAAGLLLGLPGPKPRALLLSPSPAAGSPQVGVSTGTCADTWLLHDIAAGIPQVLPGTSGAFVPQMLNLHALGAVSFHKGCYPGQEIVARLHYLGKLKRRMYRARIAGCEVPTPGTALMTADATDERVGDIVLAARDKDAVHALAVVQIAAASRPLRLGADGPAVVLEEVPYPVPESRAASAAPADAA